VTFSTDLGTVSPETATSNVDGQAFTTLMAGPEAGTAHVTAQATAHLSASVEVTFFTPPHRVYLPVVIRGGNHQ
jgi:hypothetical protein